MVVSAINFAMVVLDQTDAYSLMHHMQAEICIIYGPKIHYMYKEEIHRTQIFEAMRSQNCLNFYL